MASLLLLFAVGCGTTPDNTGGSSSPGGGESTDLTSVPYVEFPVNPAKIKIPMLSFDKNATPGITNKLSDWFSNFWTNAYAADVYVRDALLFAGFAETVADQSVIDGSAYKAMTDAQKAEVEWLNFTDTLPEVSGKNAVAIVYVQPMHCVSLLDGKSRTNYYISDAVMREGEIEYPTAPKKAGTYFSCMPSLFESGYYDATDKDNEQMLRLYEVHLYNGKLAISKTAARYDLFTGATEEDFMYIYDYEEKHEILLSCMLNLESWENKDEEHLAEYDLALLKQNILAERAKEA